MMQPGDWYSVNDFVYAIFDVFAQIVQIRPVSWGVAFLLVAILFRWFWFLAKPKHKNMQ